jgi:SnoaL-like domain
MANGAIAPFRGVAEDASITKGERQSMETMQTYYQRVWNDNNLDAIDDLVAQDFKIRRDGKVLQGRQALKDHVTETMINFLKLRVHLEGIVAMRDTVAIRLNVWHQTVRGEWVRFKGVDVSTVTGGQIIETAVSYGPFEIVPTDEATRLMKW